MYESEARRVIAEIDDWGIAHVTLARPEKRNGMDLAMFRGLVGAGRWVAEQDNARAVVLSGEGKSFCAGLDWMAFMAMGPEGASELLARGDGSPANMAQRACWVWQEIDVPVVAALTGAVLGGGFQLALAADFRIADETTEMSAMEIRYGIIPDMSITQTLPSLVRGDVALELVMTGRTVRAEEARLLGLITQLATDSRAQAITFARSLAKLSPSAVRASKRLLRDSRRMSVADALAWETQLQLGLLGSDEQREAVMAVMEKRPPTFARGPA